MLSSFLGPRQKTTRTAVYNYLTSEMEALEEKGFQTFRNEALKLLSGIQSGAKERTCQPQKPTLTRSSLGVPLSHISHRLFSSHSNQRQLPGNTSCICPNSDAIKPGHPISSAEPSGTQRTAAAQKAAEFLPSC